MVRLKCVFVECAKPTLWYFGVLQGHYKGIPKVFDGYFNGALMISQGHIIKGFSLFMGVSNCQFEGVTQSKN